MKRYAFDIMLIEHGHWPRPKHRHVATRQFRWLATAYLSRALFHILPRPADELGLPYMGDIWQLPQPMRVHRPGLLPAFLAGAVTALLAGALVMAALIQFWGRA